MSIILTNPINPCASVCAWQKTTSPCPDVMQIYWAITGSCLSFGYCLRIAVSGGWWSGSVGTNCLGSDSYITVSSFADIRIDIWAALRASVWTSSTTINILAELQNTDGTVNPTLRVKPFSASSPSEQTKSLGLLTAFGTGCPTTTRATLTVYDDGTFSLA